MNSLFFTVISKHISVRVDIAFGKNRISFGLSCNFYTCNIYRKRRHRNMTACFLKRHHNITFPVDTIFKASIVQCKLCSFPRICGVGIQLIRYLFTPFFSIVPKNCITCITVKILYFNIILRTIII